MIGTPESYETLTADLNQRLTDESGAFDDGHRNAIATQLVSLLRQAERQAKRSGQSARRPTATEFCKQAHNHDVQLAAILRYALTLAGKPD